MYIVSQFPEYPPRVPYLAAGRCDSNLCVYDICYDVTALLNTLGKNRPNLPTRWPGLARPRTLSTARSRYGCYTVSLSSLVYQYLFAKETTCGLLLST